MKIRLIAIAQIIGMGILVMIGIRAAEWFIPAPEQRIVICFANELDQVEICKELNEIIKQLGEKNLF